MHLFPPFSVPLFTTSSTSPVSSSCAQRPISTVHTQVPPLSTTFCTQTKALLSQRFRTSTWLVPKSSRVFWTAGTPHSLLVSMLPTTLVISSEAWEVSQISVQEASSVVRRLP